jgi:hypothetical protein
VNSCSLSRLAAVRTRFRPLGPLSRLAVRHELDCHVFSLVCGLPSTSSAGGCPLCFGCFVGTMPSWAERSSSRAASFSDQQTAMRSTAARPRSAVQPRPGPVIAASTGGDRRLAAPRGRCKRGNPTVRLPAAVRRGLMASSPSPPGPLPTCGQPRGLPVLAGSFSACLGSSTPPGPRLARVFASARGCLPCCLTPSPPCTTRFRSSLYPAPVHRFQRSLATALAWLGARVVRYSFPVRLFHSLVPAGLSGRYPD